MITTVKHILSINLFPFNFASGLAKPAPDLGDYSGLIG